MTEDWLAILWQVSNKFKALLSHWALRRSCVWRNLFDSTKEKESLPIWKFCSSLPRVQQWAAIAGIFVVSTGWISSGWIFSTRWNFLEWNFRGIFQLVETDFFILSDWYHPVEFHMCSCTYETEIHHTGNPSLVRKHWRPSH